MASTIQNIYCCRRLFTRAFPTLSFRGRCAHHFSLCSASRLSPLVACSPEHFPLAHLPRLAAYLRRRARVFSSFVHSRTRLSCSRFASLSSALLCSRLCSSRASLSSLLHSCLAFSLFSPRASSFLSSRLDTPHHCK